VQPTAHYAMGGLPTDNDGRVRSNEADGIVVGLYAAGECACVSVHGANRLGTNSLVDLVVFGRRGGKAMAQFCRTAEFAALPADAERDSVAELERIRTQFGKEKSAAIRRDMQAIMMDNVSVFRDAALLGDALNRVRDLKRRFQEVQIDDKGKRFNTDLLEAFELGCLLDLAEATTVSAINRQESRGGHSREDFPKRNDADWLKHTFAFAAQTSGAEVNSGDIRLAYRPVVITKFQPKERTY
jgi:succinate dehydrogenase / fumarate reductase flavoprotein subunit